MRILVLAAVMVFAGQLSLSPAFGIDHFKMLNLRVGTQEIAGRIFAHNDDSCWLLRRDGRLQEIAMKEVTSFSEASDRFRAHSQIELKNQLQTEFGKNFEVRTTLHYVVVARRGSADAYAAIFERIYREFVRSFSARSLQVSEPEFPLIAIVFPDREGFARYCRGEGVQIQPGLLGYYLASSNRVAMFERPDVAGIDDTVIHEATHQVAFNTGIHSRLTNHPKWVVEGLATVFEADGIRTRQAGASPAERINRERYLWFQEYARTRRPAHSLADFVKDDQHFERTPLDAYSEAWALSFFLIETRPAEYARYLKQLTSHKPLVPYAADDRLKDFIAAFGTDVDSLDTSFLRYLGRVTAR